MTKVSEPRTLPRALSGTVRYERRPRLAGVSADAVLADAGPDQLAADDRNELGGPRAHHVCRTVSNNLRVAGLETGPRRFHGHGAAVERNPSQLAIHIEKADRTVVREPRDRESSQPLQGALDVHDVAEDMTGVGQKPRRLLGLPARRDVEADANHANRPPIRLIVGAPDSGDPALRYRRCASSGTPSRTGLAPSARPPRPPSTAGGPRGEQARQRTRASRQTHPAPRRASLRDPASTPRGCHEDPIPMRPSRPPPERAGGVPPCGAASPAFDDAPRLRPRAARWRVSIPPFVRRPPLRAALGLRSVSASRTTGASVTTVPQEATAVANLTAAATG